MEAYAIGGFGNGVSPLQMAGAYSAFGNNGYYNEPHTVTAVEFNDGTKLDLTPESKAAMSDYTAFMITDMPLLKPGCFENRPAPLSSISSLCSFCHSC